jgi:hypothetical protein
MTANAVAGTGYYKLAVEFVDGNGAIPGNNEKLAVAYNYVSATEGSKWTSTGDDIYRNSRVLVGGTAFDGTLAKHEVAGNSRVKNLLHLEPSNSTITTATTVSLAMTTEKALKRYLLQANLTINFSADLTGIDSASYTFVFKQDGTGGKTVTWNLTGTAVIWQGGVAPLIGSAANEITVITIIWTGSEYLGIKSCGFNV